MEKIRRKLIIEDFVETTTFHGVFYVKTPNRWLGLMWLFIVIISAALIILSTVLMVKKHLRYESFIVTEEADLDSLQDIPNLLVCSSHKLSILDSILENDPYKRNMSELSSLVIDDIYMDQLKQSVINASRYPLATCDITIKNQLIDCSRYKKDIFLSFNGFCLLMSFQEVKQNASLLYKENDLLNYNRNEAKIKVKLNSSKEGGYLYFQLVSECPHSNCPFKHINNELVFDYYDTFSKSSHKYYEVTSLFTEYSPSLKNKKCFDKKDETACHFTCLQRIVAEKVKCYFTFNPIKNNKYENGLPYCSVSQLVYVEQIAHDYSHYRSQYKTCDECLPNCKSLNFEMKDDMFKAEAQQANKEFVWNFNLQYKMKQIKRIELFGYTDLLNFLNGLWSILLGISVLSIWEIIEFICALLIRRNYFSKFTSSQIEPRKVKSAFHSVFHDTYIHGLKSIFNDNYSKFTKIRWFIVIALATIGFSIAVNDAVIEYLSYNSNIEKTFKRLLQHDSLKTRRMEFLLCAPLVLVNKSQKEIYRKLEKIAEDLFRDYNSDIKHIIGEYQTHTGNKNILGENSIALFETVYSRKALLGIHWASHTSYITNTRNYYFDKVCEHIQINQTIGTQERIKFNYISYFSSTNLSIYPAFQTSQFLLDSESFHVSPKSRSTVYADSENGKKEIVPTYIYAYLKHKQLLLSPFRPSCNPIKGYRQHECHQECFNEIIFNVFGCKVMFGEPLSDSTYCHPWMIPLLIKYEKHVLRNLHANKCDHCKEPCDFYYYELEKEYSKTLVSKSTQSTKVEDNFETIKQNEILQFDDTLMIVISYFSLFYGASILCFFQIFYNIMLRSTSRFCKTQDPKQQELGFFKQMPFLDLFSNSTTVHCAKYISTKNRNDIKKIFWLALLLLTVLTGIVYCVMKTRDYELSTKQALYTIQLDADKHVDFFAVDICGVIYTENLARDNGMTSWSNFKSSFEYWTSDMRADNIKQFPSLNESLTYYMNLFKSREAKISHFKAYSEVKRSALVNQSAHKLFDSVYFLNGVELKVNTLVKLSDYNFPTSIYEGLINKNNAYICQAVNLALFQNATSNSSKNGISSPFINLPKNQLSLYSSSTNAWLGVFFEKKSILFTDLLEFWRIKSVYKNYDYKYDCKFKDNCISEYQVLGVLSEHQLFLCNSELRDTVYAVFNCTPFMIHTNSKPECSIPYQLLILKIIVSLYDRLFKCEYSTRKSGIEIDKLLLPENALKSKLNQTIKRIIDFNGVQVYQENTKENDLLQLAIDLSNWLNVLSGFSLITMCELLFLFLKQTCSKRYNNATVRPDFVAEIKKKKPV